MLLYRSLFSLLGSLSAANNTADANWLVDRSDITCYSTITRNSIHAFTFAPPEVYCFQLYLWAKYFTLQSPLLKSWTWLNPELRKSRRILISNSTNWFMKNDFRSRPPPSLILRRPRLFAVPLLLGRLRIRLDLLAVTLQKELKCQSRGICNPCKRLNLSLKSPLRGLNRWYDNSSTFRPSLKRTIPFLYTSTGTHTAYLHTWKWIRP